MHVQHLNPAPRRQRWSEDHATQPCPSQDEVLTQCVGTSQGEGTSGTDMDMYGVTVCVVWWCVGVLV